ncbi:MAG: PocR ligand-binding domain-containing protein [Massiliimalia sp.]|jgi:AraC-like DNA-binding protein
MQVTFDKKKLFGLLKNYHLVTGLRIGVYDADQNEICTYPVSQGAFCKEIRKQKACWERCMSCDKAAFNRSKDQKGLYIYHCHAGLTEAVSPLFYREEHIGYMMIGQLKEDHDVFSPEKIEGDFTPEQLKRLERLFYQVPNLDRIQVQACAAIVQACAAYILSENYIYFLNNDLAKGIETYLKEHYAQTVTLESLAWQFHISKATLCRCVKENFGKTVGELLLEERIQAAKRLLTTTDDKVSDISRLVGISDYNYFSKVFKKETGLSPREYRAQKTESRQLFSE